VSMSPYEILDYFREDLRRTLRSEGCAENHIEEAVEESLAHWVACSFSSALLCADIASSEGLLSDQAERQIFNWY
jgi:hypothetical protein